MEVGRGSYEVERLLRRLSLVVIIIVPVMQISLSQCEQIILIKTSVSFPFDFYRIFVQAFISEAGIRVSVRGQGERRWAEKVLNNTEREWYI